MKAKPKGKTFSSKFRGVIRRGPSTWQAQIQVEGNTMYLGRYPSEMEAALVYDAAAKRYHGPLAVLNYDRYQSWTASKNISSDSKQSMLVFKGDVYQGLQAEDLSEADMKFAQKHIRILSGLYGILKPLDVMKPYRLEMGTKLETAKGKNLYEFWGNKITDKLNQNCIDSKNEYLINLASNEYFDSVNKSELLKKVVTPKFLDKKNGNYKVISFFAKKARGAMASYIIKNKIQTLDELQNFQGLDYKFCTERSDSSNLVFIR